MKWIYYYSTEVGMAQQLVFEDPLTETEMIQGGYMYLRSEKVERYPWEELEKGRLDENLYRN